MATCTHRTTSGAQVNMNRSITLSSGLWDVMSADITHCWPILRTFNLPFFHYLNCVYVYIHILTVTTSRWGEVLIVCWHLKFFKHFSWFHKWGSKTVRGALLPTASTSLERLFLSHHLSLMKFRKRGNKDIAIKTIFKLEEEGLGRVLEIPSRKGLTACKKACWQWMHLKA